MSFPRYEEYKDSGVEWLGELPEYWEVAPLKAVATHNDDVLDENTCPSEEIVYVDISSVSIDAGVIKKEQFIFENAPSRARRKVKDGDIIVSTVRTYLKAIACIRDPEPNLIASTGFVVVRPKGFMASGFLGYLLTASYFIEQVLARSTGVSYPAINASELVSIAVAFPPLDEQNAIASFLDRETSKIDALVSEQRRLVELLKEKRQAVISHAVTKGLDPTVPMKPSGIPWLGDVPAHWEVTTLKRGITKIGQGFSPQCHSEPALDHEWGVVKVGCCNKFELNETEQKRLPLEIKPVIEYEIQDGDILMSRGNTLDLVGMASLAKNVRSRLLLCDLVYRFRAQHDTFDSAFLVYSIRSKSARSQIECNAVGSSSTMKKICQELVRNLLVCRPPLNEQQQISKRLAMLASEFDSLEAEAERAISLLHERRNSLISAAVTGKIDVRAFLQKGTA
jgi:type I restriction enzyme S subunit